MKQCGICGKELDSGVVVHRDCLAAKKTAYDTLNDLDQSQVAKLLKENERLKQQLEVSDKALELACIEIKKKGSPQWSIDWYVNYFKEKLLNYEEK